MIIGYDFWCDVYYDSSVTDIVIEDNDSIAFDTCNPLNGTNNFTLKSGEFDELHITKDNAEMDNSIEKTSWTFNTVLLAKFKNDLVAGTLGIDGYDISKIEIRKRKHGESLYLRGTFRRRNLRNGYRITGFNAKDNRYRFTEL